jgi:hypothetical protein
VRILPTSYSAIVLLCQRSKFKSSEDQLVVIFTRFSPRYYVLGFWYETSGWSIIDVANFKTSVYYAKTPSINQFEDLCYELKSSITVAWMEGLEEELHGTLRRPPMKIELSSISKDLHWEYYERHLNPRDWFSWWKTKTLNAHPGFKFITNGV